MIFHQLYFDWMKYSEWKWVRASCGCLYIQLGRLHITWEHRLHDLDKEGRK